MMDKQSMSGRVISVQPFEPFSSNSGIKIIIRGLSQMMSAS